MKKAKYRIEKEYSAVHEEITYYLYKFDDLGMWVFIEGFSTEKEALKKMKKIIEGGKEYLLTEYDAQGNILEKSND